MTAIRCPDCGGPKFRTDHHGGLSCRLCILESWTAWEAEHPHFWPTLRIDADGPGARANFHFWRQSGMSIDEANDTDPTEATSTADPHRETPMFFDAWRGAGIGSEDRDNSGVARTIWNGDDPPDFRSSERLTYGMTDRQVQADHRAIRARALRAISAASLPASPTPAPAAGRER